MSVKNVTSVSPARPTTASSLTTIAAVVRRSEQTIESLQEQLHNHTYMLKECVERLRILANGKRPRVR